MYNASAFLETCISNIKIKDCEYEILMVNDGSPDNSLALANKLADENPSIKVLSQDNKGLGGARNLGIKNAIGEYILFLDADDVLVQQNFSFLKEEYLDIIEFSFNRISVEGKITLNYDVDKLSESKRGIKYYLENKSVNSACNKIYRRDFLISNKLIFKEKIYAEDFEFNTRAFFLAKSVSSNNLILQNFLDTPNSITRNKAVAQKKKIVSDYIIIAKELAHFKKTVKQDKNSEAYFNKKFTALSVALIFQSLKNKLGLRLLKDAIKELKAVQVFNLNSKIEPVSKNILRMIFRIVFS